MCKFVTGSFNAGFGWKWHSHINLLCAKLSTISIIPPHWHDKKVENPFSRKIKTYPFYILNIIGADVLVTLGARAAATMILTMLNWNNSVPTCWELTHCVLMASWNFVNIGSGNGLLPDGHQAIAWINVDLMLVWHMRTNSKWNLNQTSDFFILENVFNVSFTKFRSMCSELNMFRRSPH